MRVSLRWRSPRGGPDGLRGLSSASFLAWLMGGDFSQGLGAEQPFAAGGAFFDFDVAGDVRFTATGAGNVALDAVNAPGAAGGAGFDGDGVAHKSRLLETSR